ASAILPGIVVEMMKNEISRQHLSQQIRKLGIPDATDRIVEEVYKLTGTKRDVHGR
ncbi:MAG: hypothetical protein HQ542_09850, partial [Bacteroidia bacterium]|nr:hypothetical protein [Bacteroidia bacterium]